MTNKEKVTVIPDINWRLRPNFWIFGSRCSLDNGTSETMLLYSNNKKAASRGYCKSE